jgi:hypothetical protein
MTTLVAGALAAAALPHAPGYLCPALLIAAGVVGVAFLGAYFHFGFKNADNIRSERFTLRKMEIHKGLVGDSETGLTEPDKLPESRQDVVVPAQRQLGTRDPE